MSGDEQRNEEIWRKINESLERKKKRLHFARRGQLFRRMKESNVSFYWNCNYKKGIQQVVFPDTESVFEKDLPGPAEMAHDNFTKHQ